MFSSKKLEDNNQQNEASSPPSNQFHVYTSSLSSGVRKLYYKNKALSLFAYRGYLSRPALDGEAEGCIDNMDYGHRGDTLHGQWHKTKKDFDFPHMHIIKSDDKLITPSELKCLLDSMLLLEKSQRQRIKRYNITQSEFGDICSVIDLKKEMLAPEDYQYILEEYQRFYQAEVGEEKLESQTNNIDSATLKANQLLKTFFLSLFRTLVDNYVKPYLISQMQFKTSQVTWATESLNTVVQFIMDASPLQILMSIALKKALEEVLLKVGIKPGLVKDITNNVEAVVATTENPLNLVQFFLNGNCAVRGQEAAYALIRRLPKLKTEPSVDAVNQEKTEKEIPSTLRLRTTGSHTSF